MNLALKDLSPRFYKAEMRMEEYQRIKKGADPLDWTDADVETVSAEREHLIVVETLREAHGIMFLCPSCFIENGGEEGTHSVLVGFAGRAPTGTLSKDRNGDDSRWEVSGTNFDDLSLSPSIQLDMRGCGWHGYVRNGRVTNA